MKNFYSFLLACILFLIAYNNCSSQVLYSIPKQTIDPYKILGTPSPTDYGRQMVIPKTMKLDMDSFEISKLVTYGEYKEYLKGIKKDSSNKFYLSQIPDTSMCLPDVYKEYTTGKKYDDFPVMGISWDAAMHYCRWKTIQSNKDSIKYIYRLPCESEWLDAYSYLNSILWKNDFSKNYSDWLLNSYDEDISDLTDSTGASLWKLVDLAYLPGKNEPRVLKRKRIMGDSYLFKFESLAQYLSSNYGHSDEGYRQVGFRYVKGIVDTRKMKNVIGRPVASWDINILEYWGLK